MRQFLAPSSKFFFEKPLSFSLSPSLTLFLLLKYLPLWPPLLFLLNIKESFLQESAFYLANYVAIKRYNKNIKQESMLLRKSKGENKCTQLAARVIWRERAFEVHQKLIVVKAYRLWCQDWIPLSPAHTWVLYKRMQNSVIQSFYKSLIFSSFYCVLMINQSRKVLLNILHGLLSLRCLPAAQSRYFAIWTIIMNRLYLSIRYSKLSPKKQINLKINILTIKR